MPIRHTFPKANTGLNLFGLFFALLTSALLAALLIALFTMNR
jgi:hypothetical protein